MKNSTLLVNVMLGLTLYGCAEEKGQRSVTAAVPRPTIALPQLPSQPWTAPVVSAPVFLSPTPATSPTLVASPEDTSVNIEVSGPEVSGPVIDLDLLAEVSPDSPISQHEEIATTLDQDYLTTEQGVVLLVTESLLEIKQIADSEIPDGSDELSTVVPEWIIVVAEEVAYHSESSPSEFDVPNTVVETIQPIMSSVETSDEITETHLVVGQCFGKKNVAIVWYNLKKPHQKHSEVTKCKSDKFEFVVKTKKSDSQSTVIQSVLF